MLYTQALEKKLTAVTFARRLAQSDRNVPITAINHQATAKAHSKIDSGQGPTPHSDRMFLGCVLRRLP